MLQIWVIVLFAAVYARDSLRPGAPFAVRRGWMPVGGGTWKLEAAWITLGGITFIALLTHVLIRAAGRRVDRRGSWRAVVFADRALGAGRIAIVALYAICVLALGWLDAVRYVIGDVVAADELLAMSPALLGIAAGWWSYYPIDRRLRESTMVRSLDEGATIYAPPTCAQYVWSNVRHNLLLTGVPIALVFTWSEALVMGANRLISRSQSGGAGHETARRAAIWLHGTSAGNGTLIALQFVGVIGIFVAVPLVVRVVWDTIPLSAGPLRDRLLGLCTAERVRVRELLVWRTHGTMVNGAVVGLLGRLRYILLTDALLDGLPARQVEAVMAHEIAHIRRGHLIWFIVALVASVGLVVFGAGFLASRTGWASDAGADDGPAVVQFAIIAMAFAAGLTVFGFVSRRFEWQADAFAAAHLSEKTPATVDPPSGLVTAEAAAAMAGALESVARLNHVPRRKFSWRHGSIAGRQARLEGLVGQRIDSLPIDRTVRRLKRAAAVACVATIALAFKTGF